MSEAWNVANLTIIKYDERGNCAIKIRKFFYGTVVWKLSGTVLIIGFYEYFVTC